MKAKIHLKNISDLLGEQNLDNLLEIYLRKSVVNQKTSRIAAVFYPVQ